VVVLLFLFGFVGVALANDVTFWNFYVDDSDLITFKWSLEDEFYDDIFVTGGSSHNFTDNFPSDDKYRFSAFLESCSSSANDDYCFSVPTVLDHYDGNGWSNLLTDASGLTYSDVSTYLTGDLCLNLFYAGYNWEGGNGVQYMTFDSFCWGDPEVLPPCGEDSCVSCLTELDCNNELPSCTWDYSWFDMDWHCIDVPENPNDLCGSFYRCSYCLDQSSCEENFNCNWTDIGFGDHCYTSYQPVDEDLIVCDFDECSGSTTEVILCNIRNDVKSLFCPSEESIQDLRSNVESFKTKFPFNYIQVSRAYIAGINNGLGSTLPLSFGILGVTSPMSYDFLDISLSGMGMTMTIGDLLKYLVTGVVLIIFIFWLVGIVKRIF
jgi:hypothetical protein